MSKTTFVKVAGVLFLLIAVVHLARLLYGWEAMIGGAVIPMTASWVAVIVSGYLAYVGLRK